MVAIIPIKVIFGKDIKSQYKRLTVIFDVIRTLHVPKTPDYRFDYSPVHVNSYLLIWLLQAVTGLGLS